MYMCMFYMHVLRVCVHACYFVLVCYVLCVCVRVCMHCVEMLCLTLISSV